MRALINNPIEIWDYVFDHIFDLNYLTSWDIKIYVHYAVSTKSKHSNDYDREDQEIQVKDVEFQILWPWWSRRLVSWLTSRGSHKVYDFVFDRWVCISHDHFLNDHHNRARADFITRDESVHIMFFLWGPKRRDTVQTKGRRLPHRRVCIFQNSVWKSMDFVVYCVICFFMGHVEFFIVLFQHLLIWGGDFFNVCLRLRGRIVETKNT